MDLLPEPLFLPADTHATTVTGGFEAVEAYEPYIAAQLEKGERLSNITRHMLGLFTGQPGARACRRHLAAEATKPGVDLNTLRDAVAPVRGRRLEAVA
jgi:tRNA-dihydrouridine synthase A